jgi:hypothetical protein
MSAEDTEPVEDGVEDAGLDEDAGEGLVEEGVGVGVWDEVGLGVEDGDEVGEPEFDTGAFGSSEGTEGDVVGFDGVEDVYVPAGGV